MGGLSERQRKNLEQTTCNMDEEQSMTRLTACLAELRQWMLLHHLKLNDGKTEVIRFVSKHNANRLGDLVSCPVNIGNSTIVPKSRVRNLGVIMDQHLSMIDNVSAVCASCNYHLRRLSSIRRYLTQDATRCAVQAFITSRLDYCNSLLHDIPLAQIERLQRIQNKAARLITRTRQRDHITPVLRALHWLPVCHRIEFKVLVNVFKCLHGLSPDYLTQLVRVHRRDNRLRQPDIFTLSEQVATRVIGKRAFGISAPPLWNRLPMTVRASNDILTFKRTLKTHLFQLYYK